MGLFFRGIVPLVIGVAAAFMSFGCSGEKQIKGEIVAVKARAPFSEIASGDEITNMVFGDKLVILLSSGERVEAWCDSGHLSDIRCCPKFSPRLNQGGFVANIEVKIDEHQEVMLVRTESGEWAVSEILK
ncbi:MAG: hypothetical protein WBB64_07315 [Anaerolineales bacterium]